MLLLAPLTPATFAAIAVSTSSMPKARPTLPDTAPIAAVPRPAANAGATYWPHDLPSLLACSAIEPEVIAPSAELAAKATLPIASLVLSVINRCAAIPLRPLDAASLVAVSKIERYIMPPAPPVAARFGKDCMTESVIASGFTASALTVLKKPCAASTSCCCTWDLGD